MFSSVMIECFFEKSLLDMKLEGEPIAIYLNTVV